MAVQGIEIEVGQKWRRRDGEVVTVQHFDASDKNFPWQAGGYWYTDEGYFTESTMPHGEDLLELVEHADGFKPWPGGTQPEETRGKIVDVKLSSGVLCRDAAKCIPWDGTDVLCHVVAYKIVGEATPAEPLHVELIEPPQDALDIQVGGDHYKSLAIQPVEYIHANKIGYFEGNVIKYVTRWRAKNGVKDLEKAKHYIDLLIELEGGAK